MVLWNRLLALVVGAALVVGGLLVVVEAIWTWTGSGFVWISGRQWLSSFETTDWSNHQVIAISIGVALVGLIVVVIELRPRRARVAAFETPHDSWRLERRSTERYLSRRLETAVATTPIRTRLNPKGYWSVRISARTALSTRPVLETAARAELQRLHAAQARVQVKTTGKGAS